MRYFLAFLFFGFKPHAFAVEKIEFATHYDHPPFVLDIKKQEGLVFDLARYFTEASQQRYEFQVTYVPRERLMSYLLKKKRLVIPLVSPKWFDDPEQSKYLWSDVLLQDQNVVVSPILKKIEFTGVESLQGKTLGFVLGHKIPQLEALERRARIRKDVSPSMVGNFKKVLEGRVDFLITGKIIVHDLAVRENWSKKIHISKQPFDVFERRLLISPKSDANLNSWFGEQMSVLKKSKYWKTLMKRYHIGEG